MSNSSGWKAIWESKSSRAVPDFELDRGISYRGEEIEKLSERELIEFIAPRESDTLLDAGCGTGVNIVRLHSSVDRIIGIDYTAGSLERCQKRLETCGIRNAQLCLASVMSIPLPDHSVDRILCLSVLQYLDDQEARSVLREFLRVLAPEGVIILHVKNLTSLYWSTLWVAKKLKVLLGSQKRIEYVRSFAWYVNELVALNLRILDYNSFNLLLLDGMPKQLARLLQGFELRHRNSPWFRLPFIRRRGAELKIRAQLVGREANSNALS